MLLLTTTGLHFRIVFNTEIRYCLPLNSRNKLLTLFLTFWRNVVDDRRSEYFVFSGLFLLFPAASSSSLIISLQTMNHSPDTTTFSSLVNNKKTTIKSKEWPPLQRQCLPWYTFSSRRHCQYICHYCSEDCSRFVSSPPLVAGCGWIFNKFVTTEHISSVKQTHPEPGHHTHPCQSSGSRPWKSISPGL